LLNSEVDGPEWVGLRNGRFTPRERVPGVHRIGGCLGPRVGVDGLEKGKSFARNGKETASPPLYPYPNSDYALSGLIETCIEPLTISLAQW
jgi:hypothetical protein